MKLVDSQGNIIDVTVFESYLSKYLTEHTELFAPVYFKIFDGIQSIIDQNKSNAWFDRVMYMLDSQMHMIFKESPSIQEMQGNFNLYKGAHYLRLFCDLILIPESIQHFIPNSESALQQSKQAMRSLKPEALFAEANRGVTFLEDPLFDSTLKLGITTLENTPKELRSYFSEKYMPAQFEYTPDRVSNVGKWFTYYNLPIIAGVSGTIRDFLGLLPIIVTLNSNEIRLLTLSVSAFLVAKGYHSYFEVMLILDRYGFKLKNADDLYGLYEQTIPEEIRATESYINFINSSKGSILLQGISCSENRPVFTELPVIELGNNKRFSSKETSVSADLSSSDTLSNDEAAVLSDSCNILNEGLEVKKITPNLIQEPVHKPFNLLHSPRPKSSGSSDVYAEPKSGNIR